MQQKIKDCFNARFLTVKKGTSPVQMPHVLYPDSIFYGNNTVTANILPLAFDMVPEAYREEVEKKCNNRHYYPGIKVTSAVG